MAEKFNNKYRISSTRLQHWNYGWNAAYFVTVCTINREHFFGEISDQIMQLSKIGKLAYQYWMDIPQHFPFVVLNAFKIISSTTPSIGKKTGFIKNRDFHRIE